MKGFKKFIVCNLKVLKFTFKLKGLSNLVLLRKKQKIRFYIIVILKKLA